MYHFRSYYILFLLLIISLSGYSQEQGSYFIRNFSPKEYRKATHTAAPENHAIFQDERGIMYFTNSRGLLEYDGLNWRLHAYPNEEGADMRSIVKDKYGNMVVAGRGEAGYFKITSDGNYTFESVISHMVNDSLAGSTFWKTFKKDDKIYLGSIDRQPFRLYEFDHGKLNLLQKIQLNEESNGRILFEHGKIYYADPAQGLLQLQGDQFVLMPHGDYFKDIRIYSLCQLDNEHLFISTFQGDSYIYSLNSTELPKTTGKNIQEFGKQNQLLHIEKMPDGNLLLGTVKSGMAIVDVTEDQIISTINKKDNLQDNIVFDAHVDKHGGIWLAHYNGLSHTQINSPINYWGADRGLDGRAVDIVKYQNIIFVNTVLGSYYLENGVFKPVKGSQIEATNFTKITTSDGKEHCLFSCVDGIYQIQFANGTPYLKQIANTYGRSYSFATNIKYPDYLFAVSGFTGLFAMKYQNGTFQFTSLIQHPTRYLSNTVATDHEGYFWISSSLKSDPQHTQLIRFLLDAEWKPTHITIYDNESSDIPEAIKQIDTGEGMLDFKNDAIIYTTEGLYTFDHASQKFVPYRKLGKRFAGSPNNMNVPRILDFNEEGTVWAYLQGNSGTDDSRISIIYNHSDGSETIDSTSLIRLKDENLGFSIWNDDAGATWIPTSSGIYRFQPKEQSASILPYQTLIRKIEVGKQDSLLFNGFFFNSNAWQEISASQIVTPTISYHNNTLKFYLASNFYEKPEDIIYSYRLVGLNDEWTKWSPDTYIPFLNLREGSYTFEAKSLNIYGQESDIAQYSFVIAAPWQRTKLAYAGYLSGLLFIIWGAITLNGKRLKKHNELLARLVRERTSEIHTKNEELRSQQEELISQSETLRQANEEILATNDALQEQKDKLQLTNSELNNAYLNITDSVKYAKRIQKAILGKTDQVIQQFTDGFIFFQPKDIVSGDFYWFSEVDGKKIIIAADCTGHGVPGAFMTVMGHSMLNEIISEQKVLDPAKVLYELDTRITKAISGNSSQTSSINDGMDISITIIDTHKQLILFAGAKNPLYLIRNGEPTIFKGSKFPIGSMQFKMGKTFETTHIDYMPNDKIYLFSDGFQDQFGGPDNSKYLTKKFRKLLASNSQLPMPHQYVKLVDEFSQWKGDTPQTDDILIIGIQL